MSFRPMTDAEIADMSIREIDELLRPPEAVALEKKLAAALAACRAAREAFEAYEQAEDSCGAGSGFDVVQMAFEKHARKARLLAIAALDAVLEDKNGV